MSPDLREQIYNTLNLKETDELLDIWQDNNRADWSDMAFVVIAEILQHRHEELPPQDEAVYTPSELEDSADSDADESDDDDDDDPEDKFLDEDNAPVFYKPLEVLLLVDRLRWAMWISILVAIASSLLQFPNVQQSVSFYFLRMPQFYSLSYLITLATIAMGIPITFVIFYFPLKALAEILKILMEMEFNSRNVK